MIFSYSIDLDGAEFAFIHYIQKLLQGKELYTNPEDFPFSAVIYTPLYLYIVFGISKILSIDPIQNIHTIYVISRALSFIFVLISVLYIDKFVRKQSENSLIRLSCIAIYLILLTQHIYVLRPDSMKIAFFIMFLYYYIDFYFYSQNIKKIVTAMICALLAVAAKQDAIVYILLFQSVYFLFNRKKNVFFCTLIFTGSFLVLFSLMRFIFGSYFYTCTLNFNLQVLSEYQKSYNIWVIVFNTIRLLPFYILFFYNIIKLKNTKNYELIKIVSVSGIIAAITTSFFMLRPGSYLNYSYELICIAMFSFILFITSQPFTKRFVIWFSIYMSLVFCTGIITRTYSYTPSREQIFKTEYAQYYKVRNQLLPSLKKDECIFSLDLGLSLFFADKNIIYGHEYHLDRLVFAHLGLKTTSKLLYNSSKEYDKYFSNGKVNYILTKENKENKILMETFYPKYKEVKKIDNLILYTFSNIK